MARRPFLVGLELVALVGALGCRPPAPSPGGALRPAGERALDTACAAFLATPPRDSVTFIVSAQVRTAAGANLPAAYAQLFGEGLREELRLPQPLALDTYDETSLDRSLASVKRLPVKMAPIVPPGTAVTATLRGDYEVRLFRDGHLRGGRVYGGDGIPRLDTAVLSAMRGLDTSGEVPTPPDTLHVNAEGLLLHVIVAARRVAGPVAMAATGGATDTATSDTSGTTPLFTMRLPAFAVRQRLWPALTGRVTGRAVPQYPEELRDRHVNGEVLLRFVVEPTGSIDLRTVEVLKSTHALFTRAVLEALPYQPFHPLVIGPGCPVRAAIQMPFVFSLN